MALTKIPGLEIPIRSIFCVGRNFAEHAKELGNAVPKEPVIFLKPASATCASGGSIQVPPASQRVDHEGEIVVAIGREGRDIPEARALEWVTGWGIGIDVTARDLQEAAKQKSLPWTIAKGYDTFAPLGRFVREVPDPAHVALRLEVNGALRQEGDASQMVFPIPRLISFISGIFTLAPGDLIFTGTPRGVGPLQPGDRVRAELLERAGGAVLADVEVGVARR